MTETLVREEAPQEALTTSPPSVELQYLEERARKSKELYDHNLDMIRSLQLKDVKEIPDHLRADTMGEEVDKLPEPSRLSQEIISFLAEYASIDPAPVRDQLQQAYNAACSELEARAEQLLATTDIHLTERNESIDLTTFLSDIIQTRMLIVEYARNLDCDGVTPNAQFGSGYEEILKTASEVAVAFDKAIRPLLTHLFDLRYRAGEYEGIVRDRQAMKAILEAQKPQDLEQVGRNTTTSLTPVEGTNLYTALNGFYQKVEAIVGGDYQAMLSSQQPQQSTQ